MINLNWPETKPPRCVFRGGLLHVHERSQTITSLVPEPLVRAGADFLAVSKKGESLNSGWTRTKLWSAVQLPALKASY